MVRISSYVYAHTKAVVRTVYGNSNCIEVMIGIHQGSALSSLLFVIMEALSGELKSCLTMRVVVC